MEDVLSRLTSNRELIGVLSYCWGNAALPPGKLSFACHGMIVNHYMTGAFCLPLTVQAAFRLTQCMAGAYYPTGGSAQIARTIVPVITAAGGAVLVRAPVERIITEAGTALGVVVKGVHIHAGTPISFSLFCLPRTNTAMRQLQRSSSPQQACPTHFSGSSKSQRR